MFAPCVTIKAYFPATESRDTLEHFIELYLVNCILELLLSILSKRFRCSNESNQKAIRDCDRSSKVEICIRVCACLAVQFAFFSRADSGVLLTAINAPATSLVYVFHQSVCHKCHQNSSCSLFQSVLSSRRFRQLFQQASTAQENAVCSSRHVLILVPGRRLTVVLKGLRYHHGMAPASLG
jgi:hypothetical protein